MADLAAALFLKNVDIKYINIGLANIFKTRRIQKSCKSGIFKIQMRPYIKAVGITKKTQSVRYFDNQYALKFNPETLI